MADKANIPAIPRRFSVLHRLLHILVMVGFVGLGITGFSLAFSGAGWARVVAWCLGGAGGLAWTHRACAVVTYFAVLSHLGWLVYFKLVLKGKITTRQGMFPRWRDVRDLGAHIAYFFGKGQPPAFQRFAYWEKLDYWAVLIGMNTMGLTGLVLWFPEFFTSFLPGYAVNIALVLHFWEAVLAVALKFVVHVITAHLRPGIYPMEKSIFTGNMEPEVLKHEHAAYWESLQNDPAKAEGEAGS